MQSEARGPQFNDVQLNHKFPVFFFQICAQKTHKFKGTIMKTALPTLRKEIHSIVYTYLLAYREITLPRHKVTKSPYRLAYEISIFTSTSFC